jgi:hypothetical protein
MTPMNKIISTLIGRLPGAIARQILPVLTLATVFFAGALQSAEPTFKQEPDDLTPYFVKKPLPTYPQGGFHLAQAG